MSPKAFDRFMADVRNGTNFKLAQLSHAHYRAFFSAVIPIASISDVRGAFMVNGQPATPEHMRLMSPVLTIAECRSALKTFREQGLLEHDDDLGAEWVHDFEDWNPEPKRDANNAERQRRYRDRQKASRNVTRDVTAASRNGSVTPPEVEVEVEVKRNPPYPQGGTAEILDSEAIETPDPTIAPVPPRGGRKRDKDDYEERLETFADKFFPGTHPNLVAHCVSEARSRGTEPTVDALRPYVEKWTAA